MTCSIAKIIVYMQSAV